MSRATQFAALAAEAAERIDRDRQLAEQLTMLPELEEDDDQAESSTRTRGKGKASSQLREWLAHRGYQLPEEQLSRMAGLHDGLDPLTGAMADAERVLAWAQTGATPSTADKVTASTGRRLDVFKVCYAARQKAAEALLPYGLAKVTPELGDLPVVPVVMVPPRPSRAELARDVTPDPARRMVPANVRREIEQKQAVSEPQSDDDRTESRTE